MSRTDPYSHLREKIAVHEAATAYARALESAWCRACQEHLAGASGLCPICEPTGVSAA